MNARERMRRIPPLICTGIVATIFFVAAVVTLYSSEADADFTITEPQVTAQAAIEIPTNLAVRYEESAPQVSEEPMSLIKSRDWGAEDDEILLQIAMAEAEGESTEGKALVMLVVLNRVWDDRFPDSIEDVVFQKLGDTYQFSPVEPGGRYWTTQPNADCYKALDMVLHGWDESKGALYFEACVGESWHSRNLEYLYTVGGHRFYK